MPDGETGELFRRDFIAGWTYKLFIDGDWKHVQIQSTGDKFSLATYENKLLGKQKLTLAEDSYYIKNMDVDWYLAELQNTKQREADKSKLNAARVKYDFAAMVDDLPPFDEWLKTNLVRT